MSVRSWLKAAFSETAPPIGATGTWDGWPWGNGPIDFEDDDGVGFHATAGVVDLVRAGETPASAYDLDVAIRICVNFLATNIAHTKLKVRERVAPDRRPEVPPDHPAARLLRRPNARTSSFDLILGVVSDLGLYDDAYWLKDAPDAPRNLFRLPPSNVDVKGGDVLNGPERYVLRRNDGQVVEELPPDRIVHFHWYNPKDTRVGLSRLRALTSILNEERAASAHRRNYWRNAGRYQDVVERPDGAAPWTDDRRKRFIEDWKSRRSGSANAGLPWVIEDGGKYVNAGFSPRDSEFIAGREFALDIAATAYGIPLAMLSRNDSQAFASMKEFHKILYTDVLGPWNAMIEGTVDVQLLPGFEEDDETLYSEFNIDEKMQGDFEEQANAARSAVQVPFMSVDDMRAKRGLPPLGPPFDVPARPANYVFGDEEPEEEPATPGNVVRIAGEGTE